MLNGLLSSAPGVPLSVLSGVTAWSRRTEQRRRIGLRANSNIWNKPVSLEMYGNGNYRIVTSAKEAAKLLADEWPTIEGEKYATARVDCEAALRGKLDAQAARRSFVSAAREAHIKIVYQ